MTNTIEARIVSNKHFADHLRARLLRRACPAARELLATLTDEQLVDIYLANEKQGREHVAKLRAERVVSA
jgi:hypothetical protein